MSPDAGAWQLTVEYAAAGHRLDAWLAGVIDLSRAEVQAMIAGGLVTVGGTTRAKSFRLEGGEQVIARARSVPEAAAATAPFRIVYQDAGLAIVAKPAGVVVHPAPAARRAPGGTLVEALAAVMPLAGEAGEGRPGIVHRLDVGTSGLMVVAKTGAAYRGLVAAFKQRAVAKGYLALVAGTFTLPSGRIEAPIGRSTRDRTRMAVTAAGREAVTTFTVREAFRGGDLPSPASLVAVELHTGRTHQIRVHLSHVGHPVVGDPSYGRSTRPLAAALGLERPFLHAARLAFDHPITGERIDRTEPLPTDLETALAEARRRSSSEG
ncbi:MAG TPA: RluA family pseudouridine synthase [Actinomycetota bacterium]|nr:RluA family pseudouridine synthase [Actinomycetota bacterium]